MHNRSHMQPNHGNLFLCRKQLLLDDDPQCSVQPIVEDRAISFSVNGSTDLSQLLRYSGSFWHYTCEFKTLEIFLKELQRSSDAARTGRKEHSEAQHTLRMPTHHSAILYQWTYLQKLFITRNTWTLKTFLFQCLHQLMGKALTLWVLQQFCPPRCPPRPNKPMIPFKVFWLSFKWAEHNPRWPDITLLTLQMQTSLY